MKILQKNEKKKMSVKDNKTNHFPSELGRIKSLYIEGKRKSVFYDLKKKLDSGDYDKSNFLPFVEQLKIDIVAFKSNTPVSECAFFAPRRGQKIKESLDPFIFMLFPMKEENLGEVIENGEKLGKVNEKSENLGEVTENGENVENLGEVRENGENMKEITCEMVKEDARTKSFITYQKTISNLTRTFKEQELEIIKRNENFKIDFWENNDESNIPFLLKRPFSVSIREPTAMPIDDTDENELQPMFEYMKSNELPEKDHIQLNYCAFYDDGRFDSCKQGTGRSIHKITYAMRNNEKVKHFLYGNNVMGTPGCKAIENLLLDKESKSKIETWYLAGNDVNSEGIEYLVNGLEFNTDVKELWLKRNPLKVEGSHSIARLIRNNKSIKVLDLHNTAIFDRGLKNIVDALYENDTLRCIYLESNGITHVGAGYLAKYFRDLVSSKKKGITSLWIGINRIGDNGLIDLVNSLRDYPYLERLCVDSNILTSACCKDIYLSFKDHKNLKVLDLGRYKSIIDMGEVSNIIRDNGAIWIAELLRCNTSLVYVSVIHNNITKVGFDILEHALKSIVGKTILYFQCEQQSISSHSIDYLMKINRRKFDITENYLRYIKHGTHIVNIDSIYRNNM